MENSIERPNYTVVFGDMVYDGKNNTIECPPSTVNNKKKLPEKGKAIPEGEMSIKLGYVQYQKDDNGNVINVKYSTEKPPEMPKIKEDFKGTIAENGEIIRQTADSEI